MMSGPENLPEVPAWGTRESEASPADQVRSDEPPTKPTPYEAGQVMEVTVHFSGGDPWRTKDEESPPFEPPPEQPPVIGRYRIERVLGQGGFGRVYLAHDDQLNRPVAIKVPRRQRLSQPEDAEA